MFAQRFDQRLYRAALLPGVAAFIVVMFSVVSRPEPLRSELAPEGFDGDHALEITERLLSVAAERPPGSEGDERAAAFVIARFAQVEGGEITEQRFATDFDGDVVDLRNIILRVPGESDRQVVIAAPRDCAEGTCAASSAAATATLVALAQSLGGVPHQKTLVFVSLDGSAAGAEGARQLAGLLPEESVDAVLVIRQPGLADPFRPWIIPWSAGPQSTSIQLRESAEAAVVSEVGPSPLAPGTFESIFRLAIPAGLGDQAPLVESGHDAVALSSGGERPLAPNADGEDDLDAEILGDFGRAALSLTLGLDGRELGLEHGPKAYVPLGGKLIPGWALALLALTLLLPVGAVAAAALVRFGRRREPLLLAAGWVAAQSLPFLTALVLAYIFGFSGILPAPEFPFDPARLKLSGWHLIPLALLVSAAAAGFVFLRTLNLRTPPREVAAVATAALTLLAMLAVWLANPYFALLLVPAAHLWALASAPGLRDRRPLALAMVAGGLLLPALAVAELAASLGVGIDVLWQLLLMVTGEHFGLAAALPLCLLGGCLAATIRLLLERRWASGQMSGYQELRIPPAPADIGARDATDGKTTPNVRTPGQDPDRRGALPPRARPDR